MKSHPLLTLLTLAATTIVVGISLPCPALAQDKADAKLQAKAKLTRADAEKIALKAVPNGTVKDAELEEEDGILRWSFDLKIPGSKNITEVGVDALTGKVVENKVENSRDEAKEKHARQRTRMIDRILIPVPRSVPLEQAGALWPTYEICNG